MPQPDDDGVSDFHTPQRRSSSWQPSPSLAIPHSSSPGHDAYSSFIPAVVLPRRDGRVLAEDTNHFCLIHDLLVELGKDEVSETDWQSSGVSAGPVRTVSFVPPLPTDNSIPPEHALQPPPQGERL